MPPEAGQTFPLTFRPVAPADYPLLAEWMTRPHWREWWGDPQDELGYIRDMVEGRDSTQPFLIIADDRPIGYIQVWFIADQRFEPWLTQAPWLMWLPDDAVGVDLSLADQGLLSRGIGSRALAVFVAGLRDRGHDFIIIDPDPANARAVRAYQKAGFQTLPELFGRTGDSLIMRHHPKDDTP